MMPSRVRIKSIALLEQIFIIVFGLLAVSASAGELPPKVAAVQKYLLEKEYPEVFGEQHYRIRVEDAVVGDVDDDGNDEVILLVKPHYRQSPTIVLFKVSKDLKVKRVVEGLAPGPLVKVSGDYLDSHTLGMAADVTADGIDKDPKKRKEVVDIALKSMSDGGGVVEYLNFIHTDARSGKDPVYLDMSHLKAPKKATCDGFEFSTVDAVTVASKNDGSGNYLAAMVGKELWIYKIKKITKDGFLEKTLKIQKVEK